MIDQYSDERAAQLTRWKRNRHHTSGVDAVKNAGTAYLPMQPNMDAKAYSAHKAITEYKPAASRTLASHLGLVFRVPAALTAPDQLTALADTVEANGDSLEALSKWALREYSIANDGGILIDHPAVPNGLSRAQALALDLRPFLSRYSAEAIRTLEYGVVGGRKRLMRAVLANSEKVMRELTITEGRYTVTMHYKGEGGWIAQEPTVPLADGQPLNRIPFIPLSDGEAGAAFDDIVLTNLTHYLVAAELATALKWCAKPKLIVTGLDKDVELDHSAGVAWRFESKDTEVEYVEFSGSGIASIERQLDRLVKSMAEQGLRLLISEQAPAESAETTQRREASENSILAANARHVSGKLTEALRFMAQWLGVDGSTVSYSLNTDFVPATIDPQLLQQLVLLNAQGKLSDLQLFTAMQRGELISEGVTYEQHQTELEATPIDRPQE